LHPIEELEERSTSRKKTFRALQTALKKRGKEAKEVDLRGPRD